MIPDVLINPNVPSPTTVDVNSMGSMKLLTYVYNPSVVEISCVEDTYHDDPNPSTVEKS